MSTEANEKGKTMKTYTITHTSKNGLYSDTYKVMTTSKQRAMSLFWDACPGRSFISIVEG